MMEDRRAVPDCHTGTTQDEGIRLFDESPVAYDEWFERNWWAYQSELRLVRRLIPEAGLGLEIGVGTGRFAIPLGIGLGLDPAYNMVAIARRRGLQAVAGRGEELPFPDGCFDFALLVTVICFVADPRLLLADVRRVLKRGGRLVLGFIDRESELGASYEARREESNFCRAATFYSAAEVRAMVEGARFGGVELHQTLFGKPSAIRGLQPAREGHGEGAFVVLAAGAE
jgi:SAM-dependent methyltransferase